MKFQYYQPCRVHFGPGALEEIGALTARWGRRCLLVTTQNVPPMAALFQRVKDLLAGAGVSCFHYDGVCPDPSVESLEAAKAAVAAEDYDVVLAVGGGSSMDTAKLLAFTHGMVRIDWEGLFSTYNAPFGPHVGDRTEALPILAVSTTAGTGSQVTQCAVVSVDRQKRGVFHHSLFPREAVVDPELTLTMPPRVTASSGFDAFCHACESYLKPVSYPLTQLYSLQAMTLAAEYLPQVLERPGELSLREKMAQADLLAGMALSNVGGYVVHPLGELVGSCGRMDHGQTLAVVMPDFLDQRWREDPEKYAKVAAILDPGLAGLSPEEAACRAGDAVRAFLDRIGLGRRARDYGLTEAEIARIRTSPILDRVAFADRDQAHRLLDAVFAP